MDPQRPPTDFPGDSLDAPAWVTGIGGDFSFRSRANMPSGPLPSRMNLLILEEEARPVNTPGCIQGALRYLPRLFVGMWLACLARGPQALQGVELVIGPAKDRSLFLGLRRSLIPCPGALPSPKHATIWPRSRYQAASSAAALDAAWYSGPSAAADPAGIGGGRRPSHRRERLPWRST